MDRPTACPRGPLTAHRQARRDAAGRTLESLVFRELFEFRFMQTDPNFANYLYLRPPSSWRSDRVRLRIPRGLVDCTAAPGGAGGRRGGHPGGR
jgi:hypothetical protein